jgi:hypothetical protein
MAGIKLFGYELIKTKQEEANSSPSLKSFVGPENDDGAITIQSGAGGFSGTFLDLDGVIKNEQELIVRYREMAQQPEVESAIDDICNEAIVHDDEGKTVSLVMDQLDDYDETVKKAIRDEFDNVLRLLDFSNQGYDIFRQWYVDGRIFYHVIVDEANRDEGIKEVRFIDPRRIKKIREIQKVKDPRTGMDMVGKVQEYYLFNEYGTPGKNNSGANGTVGKIAKDSVVSITSGLVDPKRGLVIGFLNKAIKPANNLRMIEDASVIYRLARAPGRRAWYFDVGGMSSKKAEEYVNSMMVKYRNRLQYDSSTGEIKDDRRHISMLEDFWLARKDGKQTTEIVTLPEGANLGNMEDVEYFLRKLYSALGVPLSRLQPGQPFSMGYNNEISRDELKFSKFIDRLRNRFSHLFDELLRQQLILKKVCNAEEWEDIRERLHYDFLRDNNFTELKESQLLQNRLQILTSISPYVGVYFSQKWIKTNVLRFDDEDIEQMDEEIEEEGSQPPPPGAEGQIDPQTGMPFEMGSDGTPTQSGAMPSEPGEPAFGQNNSSNDYKPKLRRNKKYGEEPKSPFDK